MINNLQLKLNGLEPITRIELLHLVSSWGRTETLYTSTLKFEKCKPKECYPLENLDVSQIKNMSDIFSWSNFNGDLSNWNLSNVEDVDYMFYGSKFNNDSLNYWNISNVINSRYMFTHSKFNGNISNWNISNIIDMIGMFSNAKFNGDISKWNFNQKVDCVYIFNDNKNFQNKYNAGNDLPDGAKSFLEWFEKNRLNISNANITKKIILELDDYLSSFNTNKKELKL